MVDAGGGGRTQGFKEAQEEGDLRELVSFVRVATPAK